MPKPKIIVQSINVDDPEWPAFCASFFEAGTLTDEEIIQMYEGCTESVIESAAGEP